MGFGKAQYGKGAGNFYKNFRIQTPKNGETTTNNIFRLIPPIKSQEETGKWALYFGIHWGYKGRDRSDPTKTRTRTFKCIEVKDFRSGMITTTCPECLKIAEQEALLETRLEQCKAAGRTEEQTETIVGPLKLWLKEHNIDRKWYINAMNEAGEFGVLQISHKAKKQLDARIDELMALGIDPLDPAQGVWFNFKRTGKSINELTDTVEVVKEVRKEGNRILEEMKFAPLTEAQQKQALEILPDLPAVPTTISKDQIEMLVNGSGDAEEVDAVFNMSAKREQSAPKVHASSVGVQHFEDEDEQAVTTNTVRATTVTAPVALAAEDDIAALEAKLEAARAARATKVVAAPVAETVVNAKVDVATPPANVDIASIPNADFLKYFPDPTKAG